MYKVELAKSNSLLRNTIYLLPLQIKTIFIDEIKNINSRLSIVSLTTTIRSTEWLSFIQHPNRLQELSLTVSSTLFASSLVQCNNLTNLCLAANHFDCLETITQLPRLTKFRLKFHNTSVIKLPFLSELPSLTSLFLQKIKLFYPLNNLLSLVEISMEKCSIYIEPLFQNCSLLKRIEFLECLNLVSFTCPPPVEDLKIKTSNQTKYLSGCLGLKKLELFGTGILNFSYLANSKNLSKMKLISGDKINISTLNVCTNLVSLKLEMKISRREQVDLSSLCNLKKLKLISFAKLPILPPKIETLFLEFFLCQINFDITNLVNCNELTKLVISNAEITSIEVLQYFSKLKYLSIDGGFDRFSLKKEDKIPFLRNCAELEYISVAGVTQANIDGIEYFYKLKELHLKYSNFTQLDALYYLDSITVINLTYSVELVDISALGTLPLLQKVILFHCPILTSIKYLSSCEKLEELTIDECSKISDLLEFKSQSLRMLSVEKCDIIDLSFLKNNPSIERLYLNSNIKLTNTEPLKYLERLSELYINSTDITDLTPLSESKNLIRLSINYTNVKNLKPIAKCPLIYFSMEECELVTPSSKNMIREHPTLKGTYINGLD